MLILLKRKLSGGFITIVGEVDVNYIPEDKETLKGNKNIISAATNVVNAVSNLAGMAKAADRKKDKKTKTEEND